MPYTTAITRKGQLTVPKAIRDVMGLKPGDRVEFVPQGDGTFLMRNASGSFVSRMTGLGAALWRAAGGGDAVLAAERGDWDTS